MGLKFAVIFITTCFIGRWFSDEAAQSLWLYALVTVPGTALHELAHYTAALFTEGHPSGFSLIPQGGSLGRVYVRPNWYNAALIGLAPLLLAPLTFLLMALAARAKLIGMVALSYVAACSWAACIPSSADLRIAASAPSSWPFALLMLAFIAWAMVAVGKRLVWR